MQRVVAAGKLPDHLHEELRAWEVILCVAEGMSVPTTQNMERTLARVYLFFEEKRDALIALQKESLMALANSGKANKDKEWNFFRNFMQRVVAAGKLPDHLHEELRAWEVILCVAEGMSVPTTQNMERGLARVHLFFEEKRDALIALQKESLMALANSGKANKDKEWKFFRNFMQRVVAAGKLPDQLHEELRAWEVILCVAEGMSVPTTQNMERGLARVHLFFEEKRDALIALQKESLMALANSGKANKDKEWKFFRNFMQRVVAAGKLPDQLHEELRAWEVILCVAEGMSVPTTQNMERGLARVYLSFEEKRDALIALQKESLMALANSGKANKDKEWNFFRHFMQRVVAAGKLSEALRKDLFAWESVLCAQGMSVPAALEGAVKKFIEMVEGKRGMLTGLKVSTVKELFSVHAMKQDAGLRFGYDFVRRQYQKLDGTQQKKVDVALRSVLWSKEQVPLKSGYEAKLHAQETRLGDELPRPRLPKSLRQLYGNSMEAEMRTMTFFRRVHEVDDFMNSLEFEACDYCHEGWFGSRRPKKDLPGGFESNVYRKTNFLCASKAERLDPERSICKTCLAEAKHRATEQLGPKEPFRLTAANYAYPGETLPETDALTFFEEEILSPIQHIVRIFTLYGTGQCELRGHVGNLFQNGPQYVRQLRHIRHIRSERQYFSCVLLFESILTFGCAASVVMSLPVDAQIRSEDFGEPLVVVQKPTLDKFREILRDHLGTHVAVRQQCCAACHTELAEWHVDGARTEYEGSGRCRTCWGMLSAEQYIMANLRWQCVKLSDAGISVAKILIQVTSAESTLTTSESNCQNILAVVNGLRTFAPAAREAPMAASQRRRAL